MYVYIHICTYIYANLHVYIYMYIYIYMYMYTCVFVCMYMYIYVCIIYMYKYVCIYIYIFICIYTYTYLYVYIHMYTYVYICIFIHIHTTQVMLCRTHLQAVMGAQALVERIDVFSFEFTQKYGPRYGIWLPASKEWIPWFYQHWYRYVLLCVSVCCSAMQCDVVCCRTIGGYYYF